MDIRSTNGVVQKRDIVFINESELVSNHFQEQETEGKKVFALGNGQGVAEHPQVKAENGIQMKQITITRLKFG